MYIFKNPTTYSDILMLHVLSLQLSVQAGVYTCIYVTLHWLTCVQRWFLLFSVCLVNSCKTTLFGETCNSSLSDVFKEQTCSNVALAYINISVLLQLRKNYKCWKSCTFVSAGLPF